MKKLTTRQETAIAKIDEKIQEINKKIKQSFTTLKKARIRWRELKKVNYPEMDKIDKWADKETDKIYKLQTKKLNELEEPMCKLNNLIDHLYSHIEKLKDAKEDLKNDKDTVRKIVYCSGCGRPKEQ